MSKELRRNYTRLLKVAIIVMVLLACCLVVYALFVGPITLFSAERLAAAQTLWEAHDIHSYRMSMWVSVHGQITHFYRITVSSGVVTEASSNLIASLYQRDEWVPADVGEVENYTIEALFDLAEREMSNRPWLDIGWGAPFYLMVQFDAEYGFPRELSERGYYVSIEDFEPLEE